ncbi:MAG: TspO/MBR family protein [Aminipila sp.]
MRKTYLTKESSILGLIIAIAIPLAVGALSSFLTRDTMVKFQQLNKPDFAPPGSVFPIVWTILFILMGIASYRIYLKGTENQEVKMALIFYMIQLVFNFFWSIIFFGFGQIGLAFIWLIMLWILIFITTVIFYKIDKKAGYLMIPYLLWVSFAGFLNYSIWMLNR